MRHRGSGPDRVAGLGEAAADAIGPAYGMSFCNVRGLRRHVDVRARAPAGVALTHRPDLASLIVGVNDTMRSTWDPVRLRADLLECADALHGQGALLLTARFHDHGAVFGLPACCGARCSPGSRREPGVRRDPRPYGGVRMDLAQRPEILLAASGRSTGCTPPSSATARWPMRTASCCGPRASPSSFPSWPRRGGFEPSWRRDLAWMVAEGAPWFGRGPETSGRGRSGWR